MLEMDIKFAWVESESKHAYILTVLDVFTRTALAWHVGFSIKKHTIKKVWEEVIENHLQPHDMLKKGVSIEVRNDNDPRFSAKLVQDFFAEIYLNQVFTHPYTPQENGHIESFHAILGRSLEQKHFMELEQLEIHLALFYTKYNDVRLHGSLAGLSPKQFWHHWELGKIKRIIKPNNKIQFKLLIPYHQVSDNMDPREASCLDYSPSNRAENPQKENSAVTLKQLSAQKVPSVASC